MSTFAEVIQEEYDFDFAVLHKAGEHQLAAEIHNVAQRWAVVKQKYKQGYIADLEERYDAAVIHAREIQANFEAIKQSTFRARQEMVERENEARNTATDLQRLRYAINSNKGLKTRAETAEQEKQLQTAEQIAHNAAYAHGTAKQNYNNACRMEEEAYTAAAKAQAAAKSLQAELDVLSGKQRVQGQGGFYLS